MRVSTHQAFMAGLQHLLDGQSGLTRLQEQIATGKRVDTPGDDPIAAPQILALTRQVERLDQYQRNADAATNRLRLEETTLDSIEDGLQRVRQLAIQAGDGALDASGREAIATELYQRVDELMGLMNTRGADNAYLFSGYQADTQPFVRLSGGGFAYQGDEGQLFIPVASELTVAASDAGNPLFTGINRPADFTLQADAGNSGTGVASGAVVMNQADYDAFYPEDAVVSFSVSGGVTTYSVTRASDGTPVSGGEPLQPLTNVPYQRGEVIRFAGIEMQISGAPADGDTFRAVSAPPAKADLLSVVEQLAQGLESLGDTDLARRQRAELVSDSLLSLDQALGSISQTVAKIGARLNTIESAQATNDELKLMSQQTLSQVQDIDYTEAISQLTQQSFVLQAAQQSYVKINNLSLFNYIRS